MTASPLPLSAPDSLAATDASNVSPFLLPDSLPATPQHDTLSLSPEVNIDSIFQAYCSQTPTQRTTLFTEHQLPYSPFVRQRIDNRPPDWLFLLILLLGCCVSLLVNRSRLNMGEVLKSAVDSRSLVRLDRENSTKRFRMLIPMSVIYMASIAMLGYSYLTRQHLADGPTLFPILAGACLAFYFVRNGIAFLLGTIFENGDAVQLYISNTYLYNTIGCLLLMPLLFVELYCPAAPAMLYVCAGMVALLFAARLVRGLSVVLKVVKNSRFYLFYYLCILEIAPIMVLFKLL